MNKQEDTKKQENKEVPGYETVVVDKLQEIHDHLDGYTPKKVIVEPDNGGTDTPEPVETFTEDDGYDDIDLPERADIASHKYNIEPDIPNEQKENFTPNRAFYGRHVVNSNTLRKDNFRHLIQMDLIDVYDLIPTRRHRNNHIRQRVTGEFQMCRSNPEIGGFDRRLQRSVLKREDVDVKQNLIQQGPKKKKKFFGI